MKTITRLKKIYKFKIISKKIAGLVLTGNEIKSIHDHQISINDAYISPYKGEIYLHNAPISPYSRANKTFSARDQSKRLKKLLLKRNEINHLIAQMRSKNYNLVPLQIFINEHGWAKAEIALVQNLKKYKIKSDLKEKTEKKRIQRKEYD